MKVFKFGGASIKSAEAIRNMTEIVRKYRNDPLFIVVSAMDKSTNKLERIFNHRFYNRPFEKELGEFYQFHTVVVDQLGLSEDAQGVIRAIFDQLDKTLKLKYEEFSHGYDQVVPYGELLSSRVVFEFMRNDFPELTLLDARDLIRTDSNYRDATVDWSQSASAILKAIGDQSSGGLMLTQGFIGSDPTGQTTTLGREGSDFTGAILASILKAESLTVWKDVPGILNADPKLLTDTVKFSELSYEEAAEMTYYGAKVIHPKTIKPLANRGIPLYVRPFLSPEEAGTAINNTHTQKPQPTIIFKEDQTLVSFRVDDFTFINEQNLTQILHTLNECNIRINLMQNSAISFSVCFDQNVSKLEKLMNTLKTHFTIFYNDGLTLITIKNYNQPSIDQMSKAKEILLEQRSRHNFQIVVR